MPAIKLKKVTAEYLAEKERTEAEKEKGKKNLEDVAKEKNDEEEEEEVKPHNFLKVELLWDKRKRTIPVAEQKLHDWLESNLIKKEDVHLNLLKLFEYYTEVCQMQGDNVADISLFNRLVKDKFGKFFGFQDNSPYVGLLKETKYTKKVKVQGETAQLKLRDIITEVIGDAGNSSKGYRFATISKAIIQKYPAQRVDLYPKKLRSALDRGVGYRWVELVRGVGMCGYYRLPGDPTIEEEEEPAKKKKKEAKPAEDGEAASGEKLENGDAGTGDDKKDEDSVESENTDGETKEGDEKGEKRKAEGETEDEPAKKKKKKPVMKKRLSEKWLRKASHHSDPAHCEDVFPLAMTYQGDPKEASVAKIKTYIAKYYHYEVSIDKLNDTLEKGIEKGFWENPRGSAASGTYHLLTEEFNPGKSDSLVDQISQALVAMHEPKMASASLLKKYIMNYHPKLKVESRPHVFRHALERSCQRGTLRQLSGLGGTGTFQLVDKFYPSPAILAGESSDSEEEDDYGEESEEEATTYVPKPTKRGRLAPKIKSKPAPEPAKKKPRSTNATSVNRNSRKAANKGRSKYVAYDDESEEEEVYTPRKTARSSSDKQEKAKPSPAKSKSAPASASKGKAKVAKKPAKAAKGRAAKTPEIVEADDESESEEEVVVETKAAKKGKDKPKEADTPVGRKAVVVKSKAKANVKASPAKSKGRATPAKKAATPEPESSEEEEVEEVVKTPVKSTSKGKGGKSTGKGKNDSSANSRRSRGSKVIYQEISDAEDEEEVYKPNKSRSRGESNPKSKRAITVESEDEEEVYKPNQSKSRAESNPKSKPAITVESENESEPEEVAPPKAKKKKGGRR